jgi:hypothetical protein
MSNSCHRIEINDLSGRNFTVAGQSDFGRQSRCDGGLRAIFAQNAGQGDLCPLNRVDL